MQLRRKKYRIKIKQFHQNCKKIKLILKVSRKVKIIKWK